MQKLFLCYTALLFALRSGRVRSEDLSNGLFLFTASRGWVMNPLNHPVSTENLALHAEVVCAVIKAEEEGRVRWRQDTEFTPSYEDLNDLLVKNSHQPVESVGPWCEEHIKESCKSLDVIIGCEESRALWRMRISRIRTAERPVVTDDSVSQLVN